MTLKQFIPRLEFSFNMFKTTERCYLTTYYYDTERVTWLTKTKFSKNSICDDWKIKEVTDSAIDKGD